MRAPVAVLAAALLAGCASPAQREAMVPQEMSVPKRHAATVSVLTRGGSETRPAVDSSNISDADLRAALEGAIARSGVFRSVVGGKGGDYELLVSITHLSKPMVGFDATVELETAWVLTRAASRAIVMRKVVRSSHTVTSAEAPVGVTRLRRAVEGAARDNIAQGLQAIGALEL